MATFSQPAKKNITITNQNQKATLTWDEADFTWDEAGAGTWDNPRLVVKRSSKNDITIVNDSQS